TYIKSGKPVLGFVTKGIQTEFIEESGIGLVFDPDAIDENVAKLEEFIAGGYNKQLNTTYLSGYSNNCAIEDLLKITRNLD
ncbi:MAG TPA: hypothetical protein VKH37_00805, partial [Ferruginibacter sp.]|nr:hypothetical protein [Ferruginibacter sp.]